MERVVTLEAVRIKDAFETATGCMPDVEIEYDRVTIRAKGLRGEDIANLIEMSGCFSDEASKHLIVYETYVTLSLGDIMLEHWD